MAKTVADVIKMKAGVKMVDLRFVDLPGTWQHFTIPVEMLERLPKMRKIIVDHLTACGIYLQGYNEPQG